MNRSQQIIALAESISGIWDKGHDKKPRINQIPRTWFWLSTPTKDHDDDSDGDGGDFGDGGGE